MHCAVTTHLTKSSVKFNMKKMFVFLRTLNAFNKLLILFIPTDLALF